MTPTPRTNTSDDSPTLYMALDLGGSKWVLASSTGGQRVRRKTVAAGDVDALCVEIAQAKKKLNLPEDARVLSCHEAGRQGFSLHRWLEAQGIESLVVDSTSIKVDQRKRRVKTDRIDAQALLDELVRHERDGDQLRFCRVPPAEAEDLRRLVRERERLQHEKTGHTNRIRSLCATKGVSVKPGAKGLRGLQDAIAGGQVTVDYSDSVLPPQLTRELLREFERLELVVAQLQTLKEELRALVDEPRSDEAKKAAARIKQLQQLKGVGDKAAPVLVLELFGWREFDNRKQVGAIAGLTGTPYASDGSSREQGISKAGNRRVRAVMNQLAWLWLRYQPQSKQAQWFEQRYASGSSRIRRTGIVALSRQLLVAFWRYLESGVPPHGAALSMS